MRDRQTLSTTGTKIRREKFTLVFLSISLLGLMAIAVLNTTPSALGQVEKKDIFKT